MTELTINERAIKDFCDQFDPPLSYTKTQRVNNIPVGNDAWQTSFWLDDQNIGITVIAHAGTIRGYIEASGKSEIAPAVGKVIATAFGMFKAEL